MPRKAFLRTAFLLLFLAAILLPFAAMLVWAFFSSWPADSLLPQHFTLDGFRSFLKRDMGMACRSTLFSLFAAALPLLLCIPAARGLLQTRSRIRRYLEALLYLPMLLPVVSVSMGSHKLFLALSLTGTPVILLMHIYFAIPYVFKLTYSCYTALGIGAETSARNLGAGNCRIFIRIHLPAYLPGYLTAFMMGFVVSYSQYFVNFYLGGADHINFAMVMAPLITGSNRNLASVYILMYLLFGGAVLLLCSVIPKVVFRRKGDPCGSDRTSESVFSDR